MGHGRRKAAPEIRSKSMHLAGPRPVLAAPTMHEREHMVVRLIITNCLASTARRRCHCHSRTRTAAKEGSLGGTLNCHTWVPALAAVPRNTLAWPAACTTGTGTAGASATVKAATAPPAGCATCTAPPRPYSPPRQRAMENLGLQATEPCDTIRAFVKYSAGTGALARTGACMQQNLRCSTPSATTWRRLPVADGSDIYRQGRLQSETSRSSGTHARVCRA